MKLIIVDTQKTIEYDISWVELNTPVGSVVVQENHAPMMIELRSGSELLFQVLTGKKQSIHIKQGVAHVKRDQVTILIPLKL